MQDKAQARDQQIAFTGEFRYTRGDGVVIGADHVTVKIWDDDSPDPFDEVIWSGNAPGIGERITTALRAAPDRPRFTPVHQIRTTPV